MTRKQTAEQAGAQVTELEKLIKRTECSTTHYEVLGVTRSATADQVKLAYNEALRLLTPWRQAAAGAASEKQEGEAQASDEQMTKIDRAFDRVSLAFSVLANTSKRAEYDKYIHVKAAGPSAIPVAHSAPGLETGLTLYSDPSKSVSEDNRRRSKRFNLAIPVQVIGYDRKAGRWEESAETVNVSRTGLTFRIRRRVRHGCILHLILPLPPKLRNHGVSEPVYSVYALVRRVEPVKKSVRTIGVEFVGEHPPASYLEKPWATFQTKSWKGTERRRKQRKDLNEVIWVEYFSESMQCIRQEAGRTENVSEGGMRICVKGAPSEFELVRVSYPDRATESFGAVCNRYFGKDGFERLCLSFLGADEVTERLNAQAEITGEVERLSPIKPAAETPAAREAVAQEAAPELAAAKETAPAEDATRQDVPVFPGEKPKKILVADDDPPLRKVLGKILTTAGYEVILVEDGKTAVEKAKTEKPDLVITDGLMPKMHGFLVSKTIKEFQSPPKVILLTAVYTKMQYKWEAKERYGADDLITKPFEVAELLACIEKQLAHTHAA